MKTKFYTTLLLFSLFGISLGFFGMLYEGIVLIPKMLQTDVSRIQFWHDFYSVINPLAFYIPLVPISTAILVALYFYQDLNGSKRTIGIAVIFQMVTLGITFYIVTQIDLKFYFSNYEKYMDVIPFKVIATNILSVIRLVSGLIALRFIFLSYLKSKRTEINMNAVEQT